MSVRDFEKYLRYTKDTKKYSTPGSALTACASPLFLQPRTVERIFLPRSNSAKIPELRSLATQKAGYDLNKLIKKKLQCSRNNNAFKLGTAGLKLYTYLLLVLYVNHLPHFSLGNGQVCTRLPAGAHPPQLKPYHCSVLRLLT